MAQSFECPECGKVYSRENRLVGKAVACECGRRFLVPPPETPRAGSGSASSLAVPAPPAARPAGSPPAAKPARAIPVARPAQAKPAQAKPARWADPVPSNEPLPLTEADLVEEPALPLAASPVGPPAARPVNSPSYVASAVPVETPLPRMKYQPPVVKPPKKNKRRSNQDPAATLGRWVALFVFFIVLPLAGFLFFIAMILYSRRGWTGIAPNTQRQSTICWSSVNLPPAQLEVASAAAPAPLSASFSPAFDGRPGLPQTRDCGPC